MAERWAVFVTAEGVRGCTGVFRWRWRALLEAHSKQRYWPPPKTVEIAHIDGSESGVTSVQNDGQVDGDA